MSLMSLTIDQVYKLLHYDSDKKIYFCVSNSFLKHQRTTKEGWVTCQFWLSDSGVVTLLLRLTILWSVRCTLCQ